MRSDPVAGDFVGFELDRLPALAADLYHLRGPRWRSEITPLPATRDYLARLRRSRSPTRRRSSRITTRATWATCPAVSW